MEKIKVLFVDDEPGILDQGKIFLDREDEGFEIVGSESADEALEILEQHDFDVVVSDYQMPDIDGLEFLEKIRKDLDIPFIMFTGRGREEVAMDALNLGADRYIQKGGDPKSQYAVLAQAIIQEVEHWKTLERLEMTKYSVDKAEQEIYWVTPEGKFVYTNDLVSEKYGYEQEELRDMHVWDIDPEYSKEKREEYWKELKENGVNKIESFHKTCEGDMIPVEIISNHVKFNNRELEFAFVRDISEKERIRDEVKERIQELEFVHETIIDIGELEDIGEICGYIAEKVHSLDDDSYVAITLFDNEEETLRLKSIAGLGDLFDELEIFFSRGFSSISKELDDNSLFCTNGELKKVSGALCGLFGNKLPEDICTEVEDILNIDEVYITAFALDNRPNGGLVIFKKEGSEIKFKNAVETIATYLSTIQYDKLIKQRLEVSEKKFRKIFEASPDPSFLLGKEGMVKDVNEKALERLKYRRDEIVEKSFQDLPFLPPKNVKKLLESYLSRQKGQYIPPYEVELISKDGETIIAEINVGIFEEESFDGEIVIARDVTERKKAEENLMDQKQKIKQLYEITPKLQGIKDIEELYRLTIEVAKNTLDFDVCSVEIEEDGYLVVKASTEKELVESGYSMSVYEGIAGKTFRTKKSDLVRNVKGEDEAKPTDKKFMSALSVPMGDIGVFQALSYEEEKYDGSDLELAELFVSYITESVKRLKSEKALEESEARYRALVETAFAGISVTDLDDNLTFVNDRFAEMLGYKNEELIGKHVSEITPERENDKFKEETKKMVNGETSYYESRLAKKNGDIIDVMIYASPYTNTDGEFYGTMGVITDVTEQKQTQEREIFLHTLLRHDLKNKAQIVHGYLQLIEEDCKIDEETHELVKKAIKGNKDSVALINKVRLLLSAQEEEKEQIYISSAILDAVNKCENLAEDRGFELEIGCPEEKCLVQGGALLKEAFSNIIENSVYHSHGSKIKISSEVMEDEVRCTIEDNGKGISDEKKEKIF
ncbi:MAG: PAS domain S-box protein, partial [Candidatus Saliniplasma sp.]